MTFIIENPIVHAEEAKPAEKSSLCGTTITASSLKKLKWKMMKTGMMIGMKTTKKALNSSTNVNPEQTKRAANDAALLL